MRNETLANLSHLPGPAIDTIRAVLNGETLVPFDSQFDIPRSLPFGRSPPYGVSVTESSCPISSAPPAPSAMPRARIISQLVEPSPKASFSSCWQDNSTEVDLGLAGSHIDCAYRAWDRLYQRKDAIERALVTQHRGQGAMVCYHLSSS